MRARRLDVRLSLQVMYEHKTRLLCSAEATPVELFERVVTYADRPQQHPGRSREEETADLLVDNNLGFAKDRIISRWGKFARSLRAAAVAQFWKKIVRGALRSIRCCLCCE